jgi:citrate synthase
MKQTMGQSEPDRIIVRGKDLCEEIIGKIDFASMFFLELTGRLPSPGEARVVDAVLVTLMEHGITGTAIAARLTYLGAPSALQGAVASGLLGAGDVFLGAIDNGARVLQHLAREPVGDSRHRAIEAYLDDVATRNDRVPGIGHPVHKPVDPRVEVLFAMSEEALGHRTHPDVLVALQQRAAEKFGRVLPINADGAIAAILSDVGFDWRICRGFALVARSAGLVGHIYDEMTNPIAMDVWNLTDERTTYENPTPRGLPAAREV